jgi:hypothetical protein
VFSPLDVVQPSVQFVQRISNAQQLNLLLAALWVGATHAFEKSGYRQFKRSLLVVLTLSVATQETPERLFLCLLFLLFGSFLFLLQFLEILQDGISGCYYALQFVNETYFGYW